MLVPFSKAEVVGSELSFVAAAAASGKLQCGGAFARECEGFLEKLLHAPRVLLTGSCTHALEMAAMLTHTEPGSFFAVPSFTFPSTANAFVLRGLRPVFVDISENTLDMDPEHLLSVTTDRRVSAIVSVNYAGLPCPRSAINTVAQRIGVPIFEDAAQSVGSSVGGPGVRLSAISFHGTKHVHCGEGGALVVHDRSLVARAEILRDNGTDRSAFISGTVGHYEWRDVGSNFGLSELAAAFLWGQLSMLPQILNQRRCQWNKYFYALESWARRNDFGLPSKLHFQDSSKHIFHLLAPSAGTRDRLISYLAEWGISATPHYYPLHLSEMGRKFGYSRGDLPVTERVAESIVRLPIYHSMGESVQEAVIEKIWRFRA